MRQGPNGRRPRGRPNRKQHGGPSRPNSYDSGGSEGRIRGNAHQVYEKYVGLARDAISAGDRVAAEAYFQYAEHYYRIVNSSTDPVTAEQRQQRRESNGRDGDTREPNGADSRDQGSSHRDSGGGRHGQASRGQDSRRNDTSRNNEAPRNAGEPPPAPETPTDTAQSTPAQPGRSEDDRDGLDRVLGKEGTESPQADSDGQSDRDSGQGTTRRRSRQRPARRQESEAASDGAEQQKRSAERTGNGEASRDSVDRDSAAGDTEPSEKDQGSEPAGA